MEVGNARWRLSHGNRFMESYWSIAYHGLLVGPTAWD